MVLLVFCVEIDFLGVVNIDFFGPGGQWYRMVGIKYCTAMQW